MFVKEIPVVVQVSPGESTTGKDGIDFALVEALTVTVVEGDVTYAGPAVLDYGCGMESWHDFRVLILLCENTEFLPRYTRLSSFYNHIL